MNWWQQIPPFIKILIWMALFFTIISGFSVILMVVNNGLDKMEAKEKQKAQKPITAVRAPVRYDCKGRKY
jgi:cell division protein FtsI/penicillin-binding protein 2